MEEIEKMIYCNECNHEWRLNDTDLIKEKVKNENKQEMLVTYFLCPNCKKIYIVSIIDERYRDLLKKTNKSLKLLKRHKNEPLEVLLRYNKEYQDRKKQLEIYENKLKEKYSKYFFLR